jgi:hypothetical protein
MNTTRRRTLGGFLAIALIGLIGACGGGDGGADAMSADAPMAQDGGAVEPAPARGDAEGQVTDQAVGEGVNRAVFEVRSVIRTGEISLTSKDLDAARRQVDDLLDSVGGTVESEETTHDDEGGISRSTLVLRVPVSRFFAAMTALEEIGTNKYSNTSSEDVTTEVIDVDERVETLQNSLDRLQSYQAEAKDIEDLLRYEQQITQREAELQSLKAQQSYLADQTTMSTVTVTMAAPHVFVPPPDSLDEAGFLAGLESGWNALKGAVIVVLTVIGAVLPFAVVLLLVGLPVWLLVRRLVAQHPATTPAPAAGPPAGPAPDDTPPSTP